MGGHPIRPIMTPAQVARRLDKPDRTIRSWCAKGVFPHAFKVGSRWAIPGTDVALREGLVTPDPRDPGQQAPQP